MSLGLSELEKDLLQRIGPDLPPLTLTDSEKHQLIEAFGRGVMAPAMITMRFEAFPSAAFALAKQASAQDSPFWPTLEKWLLGGRRMKVKERRRARAALDSALQNLAAPAPQAMRQAVEAHGLHSFQVKPTKESQKVRCLATWFGPKPESLSLVFSSLSCPWQACVEAKLPVSDLAVSPDESEIFVELSEGLPPGHYEVIVRNPRVGSYVTNRDEKTAVAAFSVGTDDDFSADLEQQGTLAKALAHELQSKPRGRALKELLAKYTDSAEGVKLLGDMLLHGWGFAPSTRRLHTVRVLREVLRRRDRQQRVLDWAGSDGARVEILAKADVLSQSLPQQLERLGDTIEAWRHNARAHAGVMSLQAALSGAHKIQATDFAPAYEKWSDADLADAKILNIVVRGHDYRIRVEIHSDTEISGMLTTADEEEVEVLLELRDGEWFLFPELAKRSLMICACGPMVTDVRECAKFGGKNKKASPVTKHRPIEARLRLPRQRPKAKDLLEGVSDARRLALACSRRMAASAADQVVIQQLLAFEGSFLDPAAYGQAMLEWSLRLACADDDWKKNLWAIDRECQAFADSVSSLRDEARAGLPPDVSVLLEDWLRLYGAKQGKPAPFALERAVLGFASNVRLLARLPDEKVPEDILDTMQRLETLILKVCPRLLRWFATMSELLLSDGGALSLD